jgi:hypothetical protein
VKSWRPAKILAVAIGLGLLATGCSAASTSSTPRVTPASPAPAVASFLGQLRAESQVASNGDLVVVNGNNGNAVEITRAGQQLTVKTLIKNGAGDLSGIITARAGDGLLVVNDGTNALDEFRS